MRVEFEENFSVEIADKTIPFLIRNGACIEQYPPWTALNKKNGIEKFAVAYNSHNDVIAFCIVNESGRLFKIAKINFGPVVARDFSYFDFFSEIINRYSKQNYASVLIRLAEPISPKTELLSYLLKKNYACHELVDKDINWTSLQIHLDKPVEEITRNFSKGHKSAIKRAQKEGLSVEQATDETLVKFGQIYRAMSLHRGKMLDMENVLQEFRQIHDFLKRFSLGEIFVVKNNTNEVLGGIILVFQGNQVRYFKGAADPKIRDLPILHLGIYEAICYSKNRGMALFDLWGYNHLVDEKDQRFHINKFKKGFSNDFVFYAKPIEVVLSRRKMKILRLLGHLRRKI